MSTMEKALIQIFDRKNRIIEQVKQQTLLLDNHLAAKCLIDGIVPPPWLLSSSTSHLNKEDLISGLLLPHPQPAISYSSLYQQPVVTADNVKLAHASNEVLDQCLSVKVDEPDPSVTSPPQDCIDGIISGTCPDPGLSLASLQRSKSRQRALEHRNSAKAPKGSENSEKNGDACSSQNKGSKIALLSDPVDNLELIGSGDNVVSCVVEKEDRGQCWSHERSENVYSGRVKIQEPDVVQCQSKERNEEIYSSRITRSRSSVQPPKFVNSPSSAGKRFSVPKQDDFVHTESISKVRLQPDAADELLQFVKPVNDVVTCILANKEKSQCQSKERNEVFYSGRITRSRSSVQSPKSINGLSCGGKTSDVAKCDGNMLMESISKSKQQPNVVDELLQLVKPAVISGKTCDSRKAIEHGSKERGEVFYSGRITRSRSSVQSPKSVNGLSCGGKTSDVAKCDGNMLIESISKSKQQPNVVDELAQLVKPAVMSDKTCDSRKAIEHGSKEKEENVYQGRLTRSRSSSQQHNCETKHLKPDSFPDRSTDDDGISKSMQLAHAYDLKELIKPSAITDESFGIKAKKSDNQTEENDKSEEVELKEVSGTQVNSLIYANDSGLAGLSQCDAIAADTSADSDEFIEVHSDGSASNLDGANNPPLEKSLIRHERIESEVVGTSPHSASAMMVIPKQLNFDDFGECSFHEASSLISEREEVKSLEKSPLTPLPSANKQDEATSVNYQEKYNSSIEKPLLEEGEAFSKEEKLSETDLNKTSVSGRTSNLIVLSSVKETSQTSTYVTSMVPQSNGISEQKIFMEDLSAAFKVVSENLLGNSLKDDAGSNLSVDTDYHFEKEYGKLEAVKSVTLVAEASNLNTGVCSGHAVSTGIDFTEVCSPALLRKTVATSSDAIEHPSTALFEETKCCSLEQKMELSPTQNQTVDSIRRCMADDIDSVSVKSSENKAAIKLMQPGRHSGSHVDGSWSHKRRKIDGQQSFSQSLSLSLKEEDIMQLNADKSLVDKEDQNEGKCNWQERGSNGNTSSTFMHKQFDVASVSSFSLETLVNFGDHPVEGAVTVDKSSFMFPSIKEGTADENQILLNIRDKLGFGNIGQLACDKRSKQERKGKLEEDGDFSTSLINSPCQPPADLICADHCRPELEGFTIQTDSEKTSIAGDGIRFDELDLPKTTIERASLLEQLCKSACVHTPLSQLPTTYKFHRATDLYQSVPKGLLECMVLRSTLPENDDKKTQLKVSTSCFGEDANHTFLGGCFSDYLPFSSSQVTGDVKKPYLSPVGKLWDRITSNSDSSENRGSLNPDLPCISEENENAEEVVDAFLEGTASASEVVTFSVKRETLAEIKECPNVPASVSRAERFTIRDSLDSVNTAYSFTGAEKGIQQKVGKHNARKRRDTNKLKENRSILPGGNGTKRESESLRNRFSKPKLSEKTSLKGGPSFSRKESKVNNIVSNVTSFIPLVQQKQAASVITGKKDVKVKALEAAEAAKKLAEKKENDRKMKREALKLERARLEKENFRQLEIEKKKKEEERKIKEADMAAKKRQREEEEKLERERKRKRIEEARRQQRAPVEKLYSKKDEKEKKCQAPDERVQKLKVPNDEEVKHEKMQKEIEGKSEGKMSEMEFREAVASTSGAAEASMAIEDYHVKVINTTGRAKESDNLIVDTSQEQSYDISPYKGSDDEDEDEEDDDHEPSKFIPSWASKNRVAQAIASQQRVDPEVIFPPESFCSIAQVLLPRRLQNHAS